MLVSDSKHASSSGFSSNGMSSGGSVSVSISGLPGCKLVDSVGGHGALKEWTFYHDSCVYMWLPTRVYRTSLVPPTLLSSTRTAPHPLEILPPRDQSVFPRKRPVYQGHQFCGRSRANTWNGMYGLVLAGMTHLNMGNSRGTRCHLIYNTLLIA